MTEETMCYVARFSGKPGFGYIAVDLPEHAKDNAKELSKLIRGGATIERVTIDAARDGIREFLEHKRIGSN